MKERRERREGRKEKREESVSVGGGTVSVVVQLLQLVVLTVHPTTVQSSCAWPCCTLATHWGPCAPEHPWSGPEEKQHMYVVEETEQMDETQDGGERMNGGGSI